MIDHLFLYNYGKSNGEKVFFFQCAVRVWKPNNLKGMLFFKKSVVKMLNMSYHIQELASSHSQVLFPLEVWKELGNSFPWSLDHSPTLLSPPSLLYFLPPFFSLLPPLLPLAPPFVFHCFSWVYFNNSILGLMLVIANRQMSTLFPSHSSEPIPPLRFQYFSRCPVFCGCVYSL